MQDPDRPLIHASLYLLLLILSTSFTISCASRRLAERDKRAAPTPVDSKVKDLSVRMLDGGETKFNDLIGNNKVVLINFWATWCPPCRVEIPELIALQRDFKEKGVEVIGLTLEDPELMQEKVKQFVEKVNINYKIGFSSDEMFMLFNGDPGGVIPQTFIFDRSGELVDSFKGFRRDFRNRVEGALNHALNNS
jgi:cytochrome c biogenesis protein CcmG, thiol:disulfide interchange protein DsbE